MPILPSRDGYTDGSEVILLIHDARFHQARRMGSLAFVSRSSVVSCQNAEDSKCCMLHEDDYPMC